MKLYRVSYYFEVMFKAPDDEAVKQLWAGDFPDNLRELNDEERRMEDGALLDETMSNILIENLTDGTTIDHMEIELGTDYSSS